MKKLHIYIFMLLCALVFVTSSCEKNEEPRQSIPVIKSLEITSGSILKITDSLAFDAAVEDQVTPLSTLEVYIKVNGDSVVHKSFRTKGNNATLSNVKIGLPFLANLPEGEASISFTLINIDGYETTVEKSIEIERPSLPDNLYLKIADDVIVLSRDGDDPNVYKSEEGEYNSVFTGLVSTSESLDSAQYIWGAGNNSNVGIIGDQFSSGISVSYPTWMVTRLVFNALTFAVSVEGTEVDLNVNGTQLEGTGAYFYSKINFVKGQEFTIDGIDASKIKQAYNRDFFSYNESTGKLTFLGESGTWEVYYSLKYNYFWVTRKSDVAPTTYWIIGHGFSCASVWNSDFNSIGWDLEDTKQLAYMRNLGNNKYQATVYLTTKHDWGPFDIQFYSERTWSGSYAVFTSASFSGNSTGVNVGGDVNADVVGSSDFSPGYYRLTLDISNGLGNALLDFKKIDE